jgi:hypothetical protein
MLRLSKSWRALSVLGLLALSPASARGGGIDCPNLTPSAEAFPYMRRGNRCEGFFEAQVTASSIALVGLTVGPLSFSDATHKLTVRPVTPQAFPLSVVVSAIPIRTYYRLDATLPPHGSLSWPLDDVVHPARLRASGLGALAYADSGGTRAYVPLHFEETSSGPRQAAPSTLRATLRTTVELVNLSWRIDPENTSPTTWVTIDGPMFAGDGIPIDFSAPGTSRFRLEVTAKERDSDESLTAKPTIVE